MLRFMSFCATLACTTPKSLLRPQQASDQISHIHICLLQRSNCHEGLMIGNESPPPCCPPSFTPLSHNAIPTIFIVFVPPALSLLIALLKAPCPSWCCYCCHHHHHLKLSRSPPAIYHVNLFVVLSSEMPIHGPASHHHHSCCRHHHHHPHR
jgi:hypothetical protein